MTGGTGRPSEDGTRIRVFVHGYLTAPPDAALELTFADGGVKEVPVMWIAPPVDAGIFVVEVDPDRQIEALVLRDGGGAEIERDVHVRAINALADGRSPMLPRASGEGAMQSGVTSGVITIPAPG